MTEDEINVRDMMIPLHIISLCGDALHGKTRLQKLVFLSQEGSNHIFDFNYIAAQFGPLSYKLNHTIERMKRLGLIQESTESTQSGNKVISYELTKDGKEFVDFGLSKFLEPEVIQSDRDVVLQYGNMPYVELLDFVHNEYPQYLANY